MVTVINHVDIKPAEVGVFSDDVTKQFAITVLWLKALTLAETYSLPFNTCDIT